MEAARKVCLGAEGSSDLVGTALLRPTGLYPPGGLVKRVSRELAVVFSRGARADQPLVAVLVNAQGEPLVEPRLRNTAQLGCSVRKAVRPARVPVEPPGRRMDRHAKGGTARLIDEGLGARTHVPSIA